MWITIGQQCQKHHDTNGKSRRKAIADASGVQWWKQRDPLKSKGRRHRKAAMTIEKRKIEQERWEEGVVRQIGSRAAKKKTK